MNYTTGMMFQHKETKKIVTTEGTYWDSIALYRENGDMFYLYPSILENDYEQVQRVWLCLSNAGHSGYFLWDILEEVGNIKDNGAPHSMFTECRDGSRVLIQCYHFFTKERAQRHIESYDSRVWAEQYVIRIG